MFKNFKSSILKGFILQNFELIFAIFTSIGQTFIVVNGQKLNKQFNHMVTLVVTYLARHMLLKLSKGRR